MHVFELMSQLDFVISTGPHCWEKFPYDSFPVNLWVLDFAILLIIDQVYMRNIKSNWLAIDGVVVWIDAQSGKWPIIYVSLFDIILFLLT